MSINVSISITIRPVCRMLTQNRCRSVADHRRWCRFLQAPTTVDDDGFTDLPVTSVWLERTFCRFPLTLLVPGRADHSTSQVLTTSHVVLSQLLLKACFKSLDVQLTRRWLVPLPWRHTPQLLMMHVVFRSLLKILVYAAKQACKQLQYNKAKLLEPASINGLHRQRGLGYSQPISVYWWKYRWAY